MRKVGATARELLLDRAASMFSADRTQLSVSEGRVIDNRSRKSFAFADIVKDQKILETAPLGEAELTDPAEWKILGQPVPKVDGRAFVTGQHRYASDQKLPGMLYGIVVRPPSFGATLASIDTN